MASTKPINIKELYFPHATLTKVTGNPTYHDITNIRCEVLANCSSVPSTNGGGAHGHLGLALPPHQYAKRSTIPFIMPTAPTAYVAPLDDDLLLHHNAEKAHAKLVADYHQVRLVETTILNQLKNAFDKPVLRAKTDRLTNTITCSIPEIFTYLFETFGNITDMSLAEARNKAVSHTYVHSDSINNVFDMVDAYADMAEAHGTPEPEAQLMSIAMIIIMRANIFAEGIITWNNLPPASKSWTSFQHHFVQVQEDYKRARPTDTSATLGYAPQANIAHYHPCPYDYDDQALALNATAEFPDAPPASDCDANTRNVPAPQANVADSATASLLKEFLQEFKDLKAQQPSPDGNKDKGKDKNKDGKKKGPRKYCWTHGACAHTSAECNKPNDGHKKCASFTDMKGGSTNRCFWLNNE